MTTTTLPPPPATHQRPLAGDSSADAAYADLTGGSRRLPALLLWDRLPDVDGPLDYIVQQCPPSVTLDAPHGGDATIDLHAVGYAYRAVAVALIPAGGCCEVTLLESTEPNAPDYRLSAGDLYSLFSVGWAGRAGAVRFSN
jgi:hypothetical protein